MLLMTQARDPIRVRAGSSEGVQKPENYSAAASALILTVAQSGHTP